MQNSAINDRPNSYKSREYSLWKKMIERCNNKGDNPKRQSYRDCTVSKNFMRLSFFYDWCNSQIGFGLDGYHLDKDLLFKGNKEYHPDKCVFLPREINLFLRSKKKSRGEFLVGVSKRKDGYGYGSQLSINGKIKYLGTFPTEIEAFNAYKYAKESEAKRLAEKHKFFIDARAYNELIAYIVDIND